MQTLDFVSGLHNWFEVSNSPNTSRVYIRLRNRPFPSCFVPLFQNESWSIAFHMKMSFHLHADKTHFHMKSFARSLALKKRHKTIRKWPITEKVFYCLNGTPHSLDVIVLAITLRNASKFVFSFHALVFSIRY